MPSMATVWPARGLAGPLPWIVWIGVAGSPHDSRWVVVNATSTLAAIGSGGSCGSRSVTPAARTVSWHDSLSPRFASGSSVNAIGPPVTLTACAPVDPHMRAKDAFEAATGSENETVKLAVRPTPVAPLAGVVAVTVGAGSALGRGVGAPALKSAVLSLVSVAPPPARSAAVVLLSVGAAPDPSKQVAAVPYPTKSTIV